MSQQDSRASSGSVSASTAASPGRRVVGKVVELWRFPVKSMAGERLESVEVSWNGLVGDRRWSFVRPGLERSGFPWLTVRERFELCTYRASFTDPTKPDTSVTMVQTPSGASFDVVDPALAAELGEGVRVIKQSRGIFDTMPLSILSTQSLASLGALVGRELSALRFRPNLVIEAIADTDDPAATAEAALHPERSLFPEDTWVGQTLQIGSFSMRVDQRDQRCVMVNVDPLTVERDPAILRAIAAERQSRFGVYGATVQPGRVAVGDLVVLHAAPPR